MNCGVHCFKHSYGATDSTGPPSINHAIAYGDENKRV